MGRKKAIQAELAESPPISGLALADRKLQPSVSCRGQFAKLLSTLGKPHTLEIVYGLSVRSPMRFSEIQRELKIQPKTLTSRLHDLVKIGVLERKAYNEIPPRVDYSFSQRGKALGEVINNLKSIGSPGE